MPSQSESGKQNLSQALDRLWMQFLPQMRERIEVIEAANAALAADALTIDQRGQANSAAHKLAGVLGTFGLTRGTVLAREAEVIFSSEAAMDASMLPRLHEIAAQLRVMIEEHLEQPHPPASY